MPLKTAYYRIKPYVPLALRVAFRRWRARRRRVAYAAEWPIKEGSERPPSGWLGWPDGKRFAFVLTHDVEGKKGLDRCRSLMELESNLGFHSCFNFIPEGGYFTPDALRDELTSNGFEVGVHDLKHDGKLYQSKTAFKVNAERINHYLAKWNAVGFRSAFMHHELDWLHDLNILYDASTFDTDPFEPQPDGVHTIFPFLVAPSDTRGYVEIPYTLVQDFNLFVVLQEKGIDVWKRKLDWIAQCGGMAHLDTHPDYMSFAATNVPAYEYDPALYKQFLVYVKDKHKDLYWNALPRQIAQFSRAASKYATSAVCGRVSK